MQKFPFLLLSLFASLLMAESRAQSIDTPWKVDGAYGSLGGIAPWTLPRDNSFFAFRLTGSFNLLFRNGLTLSLRARNAGFDVRSRPADYNSGANRAVVNISAGRPDERMEVYSLTGGYKWHPFRTPLARIGAEVGPAVVTLSPLTFYPSAGDDNTVDRLLAPGHQRQLFFGVASRKSHGLHHGPTI